MADDGNAEHANAIRRIITLPVREEEVFFKKTLLLSVMCMAVFIIEALSLTFCTLRWFGGENGAYVKFYADSFKTPYMEFVKDLFQNFGMEAEGISPEHNFLIQGFMGMAWFMFPASMVVCTALIAQTERGGRGILRMLALPVGAGKLCLAKYIILLILAAVRLALMTGMYYVSAAAASQTQGYDFLLPPLFVLGQAGAIFVSAVPIYVITAKYGELAANLTERNMDLVPWIPIAAGFTGICLAAAVICFGRRERR